MTKKKKEALKLTSGCTSFAALRMTVAEEICRHRSDGMVPVGICLNNEAKQLLWQAKISELGEALHADIMLRGEEALPRFLGLWVEWCPNQKEVAVLRLEPSEDEIGGDDEE